MAIKDLSILREQLPDVFEDKVLPEFVQDWVVVRISNPEINSTIVDEENFLNETSLFQEELENFPVSDAPDRANTIDYPPWDNMVTVEPLIEGIFPGYPQPVPSGGATLPPPDCLAFYLPFHYHYHDGWWGIYILAEGLRWFKHMLQLKSQGQINEDEALYVARVFLYSHEYFHHATESFATRLEITHRIPIYKEGFERFYGKTFGTGECLEEAFATAYAYRKVKEKCLKGHPSQDIILGILKDYIDNLPPDYRGGINYIGGNFNSGRNYFSESTHSESLPSIPGKSPDLWNNSTHSFNGFANIKNRVNYLIPAGSALVERMPLGRPLTYKELTKKLQRLGLVLEEKRRNRGGHRIWKTPKGKTIPIPCHPGDIGRGLVSKLIKQCGVNMSYTEFISAGR
jgi:predicted RNA binding protein YcfA (HicA-like mRNA interferase family)